MIDERQEELASLYALGALPPDEAKAFEADLESNAELRRLTAQLREASAALALSSPPVAPSPELRGRILSALPESHKIVRPDFKATETPRAGWLTWLPWALAACLAVCSFLVYQQGAKQRRQIANLKEQADAQNRLIDSNKRELTAVKGELTTTKSEMDRVKREDIALRQSVSELTAQRDSKDRLLTAATNEIARLEKEDRMSNVKISLLTSQLESSPKMVAVSLWDAQLQSGRFMGEELAALPVEKDYQLWVIDKQGKTIDAGTLSVDAQGRARVSFKPTASVETAETFAVTIERKGGEREKPTTKPILVGKWL